MTFDEYWISLVERVHERQEILVGPEETFYRLTCVFGETVVGGIESYFEQRWSEFEADMRTLEGIGFAPAAAEFREARRLLFGAGDLEPGMIEAVIDQLLQESRETQSIREELSRIYDRLIPQLESLAEYRYEMGVREGFYAADPTDARGA